MQSETGDEQFYLAAAKELDSSRRNEALWVKAMALCDGDEERARHRYIQLRAQQFIDVERGRSEARSTADDKTTPVEPPAPPLTKRDSPEQPFIHGWSVAEVQRLQQHAAEQLQRSVEFCHQLKDGSAGPQMVVIPSGRFLMGSPESEAGHRDDERQHEVTIPYPFAIGKFPVTFGEYDRFCQATGRKFSRGHNWGRERRPAVNVDWHDAMAYCRWLSEMTGKHYRLATEAEWEYACRAGTDTAYHFGDSISVRQANFTPRSSWTEDMPENYWGRTSPVGRFPANPWGLHDMHGNVLEWTGSEYDAGYAGAEQWRLQAELLPGVRPAMRGGAWSGYTQDLRSARRFPNSPDHYDNARGFRLTCSLSPDEPQDAMPSETFASRPSNDGVKLSSAISSGASGHTSTSATAPRTDHSSGGAARANQAGYRYVDPSTRTEWVKSLMILGLIITVIGIWSDYREYRLIGDIEASAFVSQARLNAAADQNDQRQLIIGLVALGWFLVTAVVFLMWVYRLNANLWAKGVQDLRFTPGWTVGWYFVPVFHLWKPYQSMKEIMRASSGGLTPDPVVRWWWALWIISTVFWSIAFRSTVNPDPTLGELAWSTRFFIMAGIVEFIGIMITLSLVSEIRRITEPTSRTVSTVTDSSASGWIVILAFIVGVIGLAYWLSTTTESPSTPASPAARTAPEATPQPRTAPAPRTQPAAPTPQTRQSTTTPGLIAGRYRVRGSNNDIIEDTVTGLHWMRCSVGQTWNGRACTGEAHRYTWEQARAFAASADVWRLPMIEELRTLVYCSSGQPARFKNDVHRACSGSYQQPTIIVEAFPNTPTVGSFWSSSPYLSNGAWYVEFSDGHVYEFFTDSGKHVRLVYTRQ